MIITSIRYEILPITHDAKGIELGYDCTQLKITQTDHNGVDTTVVFDEWNAPTLKLYADKLLKNHEKQ